MFNSGIRKNTMNMAFALLLAGIILGSVQPGHAQSFSYDGNRWYEIEVSIFTNQGTLSNNPELFLPEDMMLGYPEPIRELIPYSQFFMIDFPEPEPQLRATELSQDEEEETELFIGPRFREANQGFSMVDKARDAFIALPSEEHEFTQFNRNIDLSADHRMLYHAVWRQPVLNRVQSTAIFIRGGDNFGLHSELEGSLTISYNINRVDVDARLWRNSFNISSELQWDLPTPPFLPETADESLMIEGLLVDRVYPMQQIRQMISNELHYLDHPALGMLIEVRPYELPPLFEFSLD